MAVIFKVGVEVVVVIGVIVGVGVNVGVNVGASVVVVGKPIDAIGTIVGAKRCHVGGNCNIPI